MFDFGIAGYRPAWLGDRSGVVQEHGHRLRGLAGRTLTRVWVVWDLRDDEWFCDCPVLFGFDGQQVEINHQKLGGLSLTWDMIDPTHPVRWPGFDLQHQLAFETGRVTVFNALDENGVSFDPPGPSQRSHPSH
ncbi:hypothetical protein [Streptomyces sp. KN37]|uniref:hypothetical protein n=1 Tax=Streptomyces sp. KN37 TaxID=3090667 RepID=UPI002A754A9B|nr:hypothetical protein [Streptomyces sp. KN37]WPO76678.1 hypothetical protein R9806_39270 [Streptomyces sp. KN37]